MRAQVIYKGTRPNETELRSLMPHITEYESIKLPSDVIPETVIDPIYLIRTLDWDWFYSLFDPKADIKALVLNKKDLEGIGITDQWGFYSLDENPKHEFYMVNLKTRDPRAKKNGFKTNFAWMFCHEYLHGSVWGNTQNRELSASLVHKWEADGVLKERIKEDYEHYVNLKKQVSLLTTIRELLVKLLT